jgi:hypothetical protein
MVNIDPLTFALAFHLSMATTMVNTNLMNLANALGVKTQQQTPSGIIKG